MHGPVCKIKRPKFELSNLLTSVTCPRRCRATFKFCRAFRRSSKPPKEIWKLPNSRSSIWSRSSNMNPAVQPLTAGPPVRHPPARRNMILVALRRELADARAKYTDDYPDADRAPGGNIPGRKTREAEATTQHPPCQRGIRPRKLLARGNQGTRTRWRLPLSFKSRTNSKP